MRYEKHRDNAGIVRNIFLAIKVEDDGGNKHIKEYYLSEAERTAVLFDEKKLQDIINKQTAIGEIELEDKVKTIPQPSICATRVDLDKMAPVAIKVSEEKAIIIEAAKPKPVEEPKEEPLEEAIEP